MLYDDDIDVDGDDSNFKPFDTGNKRDQFLFSTDVTVRF
jgi:hypothetical protein